jgi:hypothetical protein
MAIFRPSRHTTTPQMGIGLFKSLIVVVHHPPQLASRDKHLPLYTGGSRRNPTQLFSLTARALGVRPRVSPLLWGSKGLFKTSKRRYGGHGNQQTEGMV